MLPSPSTGWVWPLGQDPAQWSSMLSAMRQGQGQQGAGVPGVTQPGQDVPGVPGMARGQDPGLPRGENPGLPNQPSDTTRNLLAALQAAGTLRSGVNLVNTFAQSPDIAGASAGAGTGLGLAGAGAQFSQGQYGPGTLSLINALTQGARGASYLGLAPQAAGSIGSALGGVAGLAGAGYGLSQGDPHALGGIVSSLGQTASGAGSLLGGTAPALGAAGGGTTAAGAGTAAYAGGEAALEGGIGSLLGTLGSGLGYLGIPILAAVLGDIGLTALQDKWKTKIPEGASSVRSPTSYKSAMTGYEGAKQLAQEVQGMSFPQLMSLFSYNLSPNAELYLGTSAGMGPSYISANDGRPEIVNQPSPAYQQLVAKAASGDPAALRDLVSSTRVYSGETGLGQVNNVTTDALQRALIHSLPPELQTQLMSENPNLFLLPGNTGLNSPENLEALRLSSMGMNPNEPVGFNLTNAIIQAEEASRLSPFFRDPNLFNQNQQFYQNYAAGNYLPPPAPYFSQE